MNTDPRIERAGDRPAHRFDPGVPTHEEFLDRVSAVSGAELLTAADSDLDIDSALYCLPFLDNL